MKQKLCKFLSVFAAIAVLSSVTFAVSAKPQSNKNDNSKKTEISTVKKEENKDTAKRNEEEKTKENKKNKAVLNKLNTVDKKIKNVEADVEKLSKLIDVYINSNTTGSAITVTDSASGAVTTTGSAIKVVKGASLTGFVNGTKGKLNALSKRVNAIEKSLKSIKADSANLAKYNELVDRLNTLRSKIAAETKLLNSLTAKK